MKHPSSDYAQQRLLRPVALACLVWLCSCAVGAVAADYNLPALGEPSVTTLSPQEGRRIGGRVFSQLLRAGRIVEDPELTQYIQSVGARLVEAAGKTPGDFRFFVINNSTINAFALPGGFIGVNTGLILETDSESELAAVMAHEISHVTQRHIARQIEATKGTQWATLAALLGMAIAAGGDPDAIQAAITGSMSIIRQQQVSYTRAHELEADRLGIRLLAAAHFDPSAMARFFETMQRHARLYGKHLPQILLTHPVNNTRIAEARARATNYPAVAVTESVDYPIMKARARFLTTLQRSALLNYYQSRGAPASTSDAMDYGYALTLAHLGQPEQAAAILQRLVKSHPQQAHYVVALARAQAYAGHAQAGLATLKAALRQFPSDLALTLQYATTLINSGQPDAARQFLTSRPQLTRRSYHAQELLARSAGAQGRLGEAYYRQAMYRRLRGAYVPAIRKLRGVLHNNTSLSPLDRNRLDALLDQIITQCKIAWPDGECQRRVLNRQRY